MKGRSRNVGVDNLLRIQRNCINSLKWAGSAMLIGVDYGEGAATEI